MQKAVIFIHGTLRPATFTFPKPSQRWKAQKTPMLPPPEWVRLPQYCCSSANPATILYRAEQFTAGLMLFTGMMHPEYGYGGLIALDVKTVEKANELMEMMQHENLGYLAVSLGFYKTLFSASGTSTSSEIPEDEQKEMGLSPGLIRFSIGLDHDIERTYHKMRECMIKTGVL